MAEGTIAPEPDSVRRQAELPPGMTRSLLVGEGILEVVFEITLIETISDEDRNVFEDAIEATTASRARHLRRPVGSVPVSPLHAHSIRTLPRTSGGPWSRGSHNGV